MIENLTQIWPAPSTPQPIVIIGAGDIVRDAHLPAYAKAGLPVVALVDINTQRRTRLADSFGIETTLSSVCEAVAIFGTSVVYDIAVPPLALPDILANLPIGATVLMQKPMGLDLTAARKIKALCRNRHLIAAVNFQLRYAPIFMVARQVIEQGLIGKPLDLEVHINIFTPWTIFPFLLTMPRVELLVHSIHYLDTIRALFGTPQAVFARSLDDPRAPGFAQTRTSVLLDWHDQRRGIMSINHNHQAGRKFQDASFRIEGTDGTLMIKLGVLYDYPNGEDDAFWYSINGEEWRQLPLKGNWFFDSFMGPMRNLQRYVAGEDQQLFTSVDEAFTTMALVEACFDANQTPGTSLQRE